MSRTLYWARVFLFHCSPSDRVRLFGALALACATLIPVILSPLLFAALIDRLSQPGEGDQISLIILGVGFLLLRFAGQAMVDLRFILINPILYRIIYNYSEYLTIGTLEKVDLSQSRYNRVADVSEKVVIIESAQLALMNLAYGIIVVVIPSAIEIGMTLVIAVVVLGPVITASMITGLLAISMSLIYGQSKEVRSFARANDADNRSFREIGQVLGYCDLIREFDAYEFFRKRLRTVIEESNKLHKGYFWIKSKRSLFRSFIMTCSIGFVLVLSIIAPVSGVLSAGDIFLVLWYVDRLLMPLSSIAATMVGIENSVVQMETTKKLYQNDKKRAAFFYLDILDNKLRILINNQENEVWPLEGLDVPWGAGVYLSGKTGSGKTTLLKELYYVASRRNRFRVFYCPERPLVVEGSVRNNLEFEREDEAAIALWLEFWANYMKRQGPSVEQAADTLSAGEMQLLGILRACSRLPELLIIDEGLSAMDRYLEEALLLFLSVRLPKTIMFLVSHRDIPSFKPIINIHMSDACIKNVDIS